MAMTVGVARLGLYLEGTTSLKDKRSVVHSLIRRVRDKFNVAVAEVADLDDMRAATIAIVCVRTSAPTPTRCCRPSSTSSRAASNSASSARSRPS
jgi:uncharacterized protein YlxP (DUF503 family)